MKVWKFLWGQRGRRPSVNQLDHETIAKDKETGTLTLLIESSGGVKDVIEITGSAPGTSQAHARAHQIDSADDHPAVDEEKRGKWAHSNAETGAIELVDLPEDLGSNGIVIPTLKMSFGHYRAAGDPVTRRDNLYALWDADDDTFLQHNPEIWTFRKRNNFRRELVNENLGDELCLDPVCEKPEAWIIVGSIAVTDGVIAFTNAAEGDTIAQILSTSLALPWAWYELTFTVSGYLSGAIKAYYSNGVSPEITANGTYTFRLRRTSQNAGISFTAYGTSTSLRIDNISFKRVWREFNLFHKKKWAHEPHLNGVKFPESNFWAGQTVCKVAAIQAAGRNTEFELTADRNEKQLIELDPYEYIYAQHKVTDQFFKLSDSTDLSTIKALEAAGRGTLSIGFRFAIVIDHPSVPGEKLIGDLSDEVFLRAKYMTNGYTPPSFLSLLLRYRSNAIILRN